MSNAFQLLDVVFPVAPGALQTAFSAAAHRSHPDKGGSHDAMLRVLWARGVLANPVSQAQHLEVLRPCKEGASICLCDLHKRTELNDRTGVAGSFDGLRLRVLLGGMVWVSVRPENVRAASPPAPTAWASARGDHAAAGAAGAGAWAWAARGEAAAGTTEEDSRVACPGPASGGDCPNWAYVLPRRVRCRTCARSQPAPPPAPSPPPPAPPPPPPFPPPGPPAYAANLDAAMRVAEALAEQGESGFAACGGTESLDELLGEEALWHSVLRRLCLIADTDVVGTKARKEASHCGGVPPVPGQLVPFWDTPGVADPGNAVYAGIVRRLLAYPHSCVDRLSPWGHEQLVRFNDEHLGDVVEAALAAANAAADAEEGRSRTWAGLRGGACGSGDRVTRFLVRAVHWAVR